MGVALLTDLIQDLAFLKDTVDRRVSPEEVVSLLETGELVSRLKHLSEDAQRVLGDLGEMEAQWLQQRLHVTSLHYTAKRLGIQHCGLCYLISLCVVALRALDGYDEFRERA